jgi:hypothetical protein
MESLITQAMAITTISKILVDMTRLGFPTLPKWVPPLAALVYSIVIAQLLLVASGADLTRADIAQSILSGILAAGTAIGVTELQKRVQ